MEIETNQLTLQTQLAQSLLEKQETARASTIAQDDLARERASSMRNVEELHREKREKEKALTAVEELEVQLKAKKAELRGLEEEARSDKARLQRETRELQEDLAAERAGRARERGEIEALKVGTNLSLWLAV